MLSPSRMRDRQALQVDRQLVARGDRRLELGELRRRDDVGASPVLIAFVRKMSPNDGAITTRKPKSSSAHAACSREEPQPKLRPGDQDRAPRAPGRRNSKSASFIQSKNRNSP